MICSNVTGETSGTIDEVMEAVLDIGIENLTNAKYASCGAERRPEIHIDVSTVCE